jgi:hypothetical protein
MRQEVALDETGAPVVRAFRSEEGQLTFRYLTCRAGGMSIWAPITDEIMRRIPASDRGLDVQLRRIALALARDIGAREAQALERVDTYEETIEALTDELEATRQRLAELDAVATAELDAAVGVQEESVTAQADPRWPNGKPGPKPKTDRNIRTPKLDAEPPLRSRAVA